jgi:hypothetical protein
LAGVVGGAPGLCLGGVSTRPRRVGLIQHPRPRLPHPLLGARLAQQLGAEGASAYQHAVDAIAPRGFEAAAPG